MALVEVHDVTKQYRTGDRLITPLAGVSLQIHRGEFLVLTGSSGSGKTTFLNLLVGIDRPTSGRIVVDGTDLAAMSRDELARWRAGRVGYIIQLSNLIPVLTAYENVELPLLLQRLPWAQRRQRVRDALDAVGLADRARHYPDQLSGGQAQRIGIARAMVAKPTIIVADEPTNGLDAETAAHIVELLKRVNTQQHTTLVVASHDQNAMSAAERALRLENGTLVDLLRRREKAAG